eukprot:scaffold2639_cov361-Pavlova_lutheri.AAC.38
MALACVFMAAPSASSFITGTVLVVDGGVRLQRASTAPNDLSEAAAHVEQASRGIGLPTMPRQSKL